MTTRVLAVDDDIHVLRMLQRVLAQAGYDVSAARSAAEAYHLAGEQKFDVAVVDYTMEPQNGVEVLSALSERQPTCARILMSGYLALPAVVAAVNRGGVARILEKPFTTYDALSAIDEAIATARLITKMAQQATAEVAVEERRLMSEVLGGGFLKLALQPIVRTTDRSLFAYEALLRSTHRTVASPVEVLAAAEKLSMVSDVGSAVARLALDWLGKLPPDARLFLNMHPSELSDTQALAGRLTPLRPFAQRLVLEITERARLADAGAWHPAVAWLRANGFSIALDDLGAGYSSLSMLAELEPHYIKVDMSIVRNIHNDERKRRLVDLLCRFAEATGVALIAEGVEVVEEADALAGLGVSLLQGYLFGRPVVDL